MNRTEAEDLAVRLAQTWPKALPAAMWEDTLRDLDAGTAGTAYVRLRGSIAIPSGPSIADFLAMYRSLDTKRPEQYANCDHCGNTGWQYHEHANGVTPCRCPRGRDHEQVHQRILDHNADELHRLGLDRDSRPSNPARPAA